MQGRRVALVASATVSLGVALALAVVAVLLVVALMREYGSLWTDFTIYLILAVPVLPALLGAWLLRGRARDARDRWWPPVCRKTLPPGRRWRAHRGPGKGAKLCCARSALVRAATVAHGQQRAPMVANGSEKLQVAGPAAQAAGMMHAAIRMVIPKVIGMSHAS
jgi:hypothetical protein